MASHPQPQITHSNLPQLFLKARDGLMSHFRPILKHFGLTDQQWRILRVLDEHGQLESHEICTQCQMVSASMAGVLARMEEMALLERQRLSTDQRRVVVRLAPKGRQLVSEMAPLIDQQYQHLEDALGAPVFAQVLTSLEAFIAALAQRVPTVDLPPASAGQARLGSGAPPPRQL
jgi:homoprotocatechuate degradation regulator HpaR